MIKYFYFLTFQKLTRKVHYFGDTVNYLVITNSIHSKGSNFCKSN